MKTNTTPIICRIYSDGEIIVLFPEDTAKNQTTALCMQPSSKDVFYTHYEEVDYHIIIQQTRPLETEAAKEPISIAQRDEIRYGTGRTLIARKKYKFASI